ncbi:type II secretion system F family protein [Streptomyces sp. NPDC085481]|uniref:type II secretion system F family protein n=1 Tax=Streptomyces sp. NPDC085481 TaxID=3365727 RepID=UPI0037D3C887
MTGELLHRFGVVLVVLCALVWAAGAVAGRRRDRRARRRIAVLLAAQEEAEAGAGRPRGWTALPPRLRAWAVPCVAGLVGYLLIGGVLGPVAGIGAAWGLRWWRAGRPPGAVQSDAETERQLTLAADLLAACASAGAAPGESAEAVGRPLGGPVGKRLLRTAAELRLGGEPAEVWRRFGAIPGAEGLARCLERAASSGAPAAEAVARHAEGLRAAGARAAAARAQRAQVLITAPVGLCFLPAFLAVGVAPVVIGLASGLLGAR